MGSWDCALENIILGIINGRKTDGHEKKSQHQKQSYQCFKNKKILIKNYHTNGLIVALKKNKINLTSIFSFILCNIYYDGYSWGQMRWALVW